MKCFERSKINKAIDVAVHFDFHAEKFKKKSEAKMQDLMEFTPQRLERCEYVLNHRTTKMVLVLDRCVDVRNQEAMLRTAEL